MYGERNKGNNGKKNITARKKKNEGSSEKEEETNANDADRPPTPHKPVCRPTKEET